MMLFDRSGCSDQQKYIPGENGLRKLDFGGFRWWNVRRNLFVRARGVHGVPLSGDGSTSPDTPRQVPVPGALRELSELFQKWRTEFDRKRGQRPVTNRGIARLAVENWKNYHQPGQPKVPLVEARADGDRTKGPPIPDSIMSGVLTNWADVESVSAVKRLVIPSPALAFHIVKGFGGTQRDALLAGELAERARVERGMLRNSGPADAAPGPPPSDGQLHAVVTAILAHLVRASKPGPLGKLPAAVELALCRAIVAFAAGDAGAGKTGLAWPLLDPDGFLAAPEVAAILARALTGGYLEGAPLLGQAWARAFLDGTHTTDLTADAEDLLGFLWQEARELPPWTDMATKELRRRLLDARQELADLDRVSAFDIGRPARNLPPELRPFLRYQVPLVAKASRGFVGRKSVLKNVDSFIKGDEDGYFFILAKLGVGKTALLAHLVADQPEYARHFNVLGQGMCTTGLFLNNVCAQLIGAYHLDPGLFPRSGDATTDLLLRLLEQGAVKAPGNKPVVVVDALDEAMAEPRLPGVNPLSLPGSLPGGCRFIVTVRKGSDGWNPPGNDDRQWRPPIDGGWLVIEEGSQDNKDDALAYVRSRLSSGGIASYLRVRGDPTGFADALVERSEGYFVYLRHVLDQYDAEGEEARQDVTELPVGLMPYYESQYKRIKSDTPQREWDRVRLPVLAELAVAPRPLTYEELRSRAGLEQSDLVSVVSAIQQWQEFLVGSYVMQGGKQVRAYRLFHESFREFLKTREDTAVVAEAQRARREEREGQARARYGGPRYPRPRRPRRGADG
jgi:hypothetical protein